MELGYGSEFHLLRFLGRHRDFLTEKIAEIIGSSSDKIKWLDFSFGKKEKYYDKELKDIECFKLEGNFAQIETNWKSYWPRSGNSQNWDAIFKADDIYYFIEAKAHSSEIKSKCTAISNDSKEIIKAAFEKTIVFFGVQKTADDWLKSNSYQFANRLAFVNFCNENGIKSRLVYVDFLNGYENPSVEKSIKTETEWKALWAKEYKELGVKEAQLSNVLFHVYIDCHGE